MRTFSIGMMVITFVLGVGAISVFLLLGKMIWDLVRDGSRNRISYFFDSSGESKEEMTRRNHGGLYADGYR